MAGNVMASRVVLFLAFIACTIYSITFGTDRVRQVVLRDRVLSYYAKNAPDNTPNDKKMEKLLAKYGAGEEHLLEAALKTKYGVGTLPAGKLSAALLQGRRRHVVLPRALRFLDGDRLPSWHTVTGRRPR